MTLAGLVVGGLVHATLATVGISALVLSSETLYTALRLAGALYLLYIGGITLWATRPRRGTWRGWRGRSRGWSRLRLAPGPSMPRPGRSGRGRPSPRPAVGGGGARVRDGHHQ